MTQVEGLLFGIEIGGTNCVCIAGRGPNDIRDQHCLLTAPDAGETLERIAAVLRLWEQHYGACAGIGLACFGPLELRANAAGFGRIERTPKPGWEHADVLGFFARRFAAPVAITTDVIGAALAEGSWGAAIQLQHHAYITVGTGVGVGLVVAGKPLIGWHHPELGHIRTVRLPGDEWPGSCRFHGACVEGIASGPAIALRAGAPPASLPADSVVWEPVAFALAQLCHTLALSVAPERIVFGGGVVRGQTHLLARIRRHFRESINDYIDIKRTADTLENYIVAAQLGVLAGPLGALRIAARAGTTGEQSAMDPGGVL
jgi:fructokinase